jgi:hydroxymethylpyrimidine/phosphomethylpyrimidine kinase
MAVGGSSTTGAAGVEADVKTFASFGVHAAVVVTAIASQNTRGVQDIFPLPANVISRQIDSILSDMEISAVKIGMLGNESITSAVYDGLRRWRGTSIVLDPVMTAQSDGRWLVDRWSIDGIEKLVRLSKIVTPNRMEAENLTGLKIRSMNDAKKAASLLKNKGAEAVLVKGIKQGNRISDLLLHKNFKIFSKEIIPTGTHGGGCCFSSAIAACLAKGFSIDDSCKEAECFIDGAIRNSVKIGRGIEAVDPTACLRMNAERFAVLYDVKAALMSIENSPEFSSLIPEIGTNIVRAIPNAKGINDVAGVAGRVRNAMGAPKSLGVIEFGASSHLARAVLKMIEFDSSKTAAINVRLTDETLAGCKKTGLKVSSYDRSKEPQDVKRKEGSTIPWGIETAVKNTHGIPDVVYHRGEAGKEPSLIIFGSSARDVARLAMRLVSPKAKV